MNAQQLQSIIRAILLMCGTVLTKKGITDSATWETVVGFIVGLVPLIWSWNRHADPPGSLPTPPAGPILRGPLMLLLCCGLWTMDCGLITGCKSTPQQVAYQSAGTTIVTVDTAMTVWGDYVAAKHPGPAAEATVKAAYEKYQAAMVVLCDAGAAYAATGGTDATAMNGLTQAAFNATTYLQDLEKLIATFGVNLNAPP